MRKNISILRFLSLFTLVSLLLTTTACQLSKPAVKENKPPELEDILRSIHKSAAELMSCKTKLRVISKTESRFFTVEDKTEGNYYYAYDSSRSLIGAKAELKTNTGTEDLIWLPANGYIRRNEGSWEQSTQYPDQSYSLLTAYNVFAKLESRMQLLPVADHPELVEFYYDHTNRTGLTTLAGLGDINLQQLPLKGLRALAHFFFRTDSGQLQQVDFQIEDTRDQQILLDLQLLFYDVNQEVRLEAPSSGDKQAPAQQETLLDATQRWNQLSELLEAAKKFSSYHLLSDLKYVYKPQGQKLQGHTVNQGQVVQEKNTYFQIGDRRIQNDRVEREVEFAENPEASYLHEKDGWVRQNAGTPDHSPVQVLLTDLLSLNQGLTASSTPGKTVYSYSGQNQIFFLLCKHLFDMDLSELRGQDIRIDLSVTIDDEKKQVELFRIRLRSPYNDTLDLTGSLQFLNYDAPITVSWPEDIGKDGKTTPTTQPSLPAGGYAPGGDGPAAGEGEFHPAPEHAGDWKP